MPFLRQTWLSCFCCSSRPSSRPTNWSAVSDRSQHYKRRRRRIIRIPFTLTFYPHNQAVKSIILKNFKLLQNDPDTGRIFSQPPLISFKRDKNMGNFLVRSVFQTSNQTELLNAHAHDAKHVLLFATLRNCRDQSDRLRSLIILLVPQPMSSTV